MPDVEAEDTSAESGGSGTNDSGADNRRRGWRGVRKFDGLVDPTSLLAQVAVTSVLPRRVLRSLRDAKPLVVVITVPSSSWVGPVEAVVGRMSGYKAACIAKANRPRASAVPDPDIEAAEQIAEGRPAVAITPDSAWIAPLLLAAADERIDVPPLDASLVNRAIGMWCGRRPRRAIVPEDLAGLDLHDVAAALRPGAAPAGCVARIRRASHARVGLPDGEAVTPLDRLTGYGEAHVWATRAAADIARVRRGEIKAEALEGAILYGPPGTGKSTLARSLAQAAGVVFVETSVGQWFANSPGFLDSVIKQISAFCDRLEIAARQQGCAVGFVDELDALPNRSRLDDRAASWWLPAITFCLLRFEQLRKAGVVLVAATNDLSRVDTALLRPGRFDRSFLIGPPDEAGRLGILRVHLGADLVGVDLTPALRISRGMTGAVLAGSVRAARRQAQMAGRAMTRDDLLAEIAPADSRPAAQLRAVALHESGHALVAIRLGLPVVQVSIEAGDGHGGSTIVAIRDPSPDRNAIERQVVGLLAGRAADGILGEGIDAGAASDLRDATRRLAEVHGAFGLGETLSVVVGQQDAARLLRENPAMAARVEADLSRLQLAAQDLVRANRVAVLALVEALLTRRVMTGEEVAEIAAAHKPRIRVRADHRIRPKAHVSSAPDSDRPH
ncbi:AAA family ATPase [Methylobacterium sp. WL9]|nr:AAA family ATPase [Methylobacterium sp. WL9]